MRDPKELEKIKWHGLSLLQTMSLIATGAAVLTWVLTKFF